MSLETDTKVEEIRGVQDEDGNNVPPAAREAQGNWATLSGFSHSTGGAVEETLPSNAVPDGATVLVHADPANTGDVFVGPAGTASYPLPDALTTYTAQVSDTGEIAVRTPNSGDTVHVHYEDTA